MAVKFTKRDGNAERSVLIGMICSTPFLGQIAARYESNLCSSRWSNLVAQWCVKHYGSYHRAPQRDIVGYFDDWAASDNDRETLEIVERFLSSLSDEWERLKHEISPDYLLDVAGKLFNRHRAAELRDALESDLDDNAVDRALERINKFRKIEIGLGSGVNLLSDPAVIEASFADENAAIIEYPDAIGQFFGNALCRDGFIAFNGKDKGGKSFWLHDIAWRGIEQERNVAYFEVGDMSQSQLIRRFAARACGRPVTSPDGVYPYRYEYPVRMEPSVGGTEIPELETEMRRIREPLEPARVAATFAEIGNRVGVNRLKLSCHANSSISIRGIETIIEGWARDDWRPDVVVIDYSDILAPINSRAETTRDQINETWKAMRGMSQTLHCLVVTATQADSDSYDAWVLTRANFSEDKRKNAHVTGMVGINQTGAEKERNVQRLNWINRRDLDFSERRCVWLASCLAISDPAVLSTF